MPAGPVIIDLTHRDAPIEISDDSDTDDAELPVAVEPAQPVSSVVRQRNVDERRARLLQRGIDEEAEERARQRQIARDEQIARRLQAMGGEGDIGVIQISSGEDSNDESDGHLGRSSSPEDIHAARRRLARQERDQQELRGSPPRRRYPQFAGPSNANNNDNIPQAGPSNTPLDPIPIPDYIPHVPAPSIIRRMSRSPSRTQFHAQNHPPPPPTADELIGRGRFQSPAPRLGLGGGGIFSNRHPRAVMTMHQRSVARERAIMSLARDGIGGLGGFLRGWGGARGNNGEGQGERGGGPEAMMEHAEDPPEIPPPPPAAAAAGWRVGLGNLLRMRLDPGRPQQQPFVVYGGEPPAPELPDAPEYRPEFTHPKGCVKSGFSGDFERRADPEVIDLDEAAGSGARKGKGKAKAVTPLALKPFKLVCASCKSGLKVNGEDGERVYGLRCGHVLDGACVGKMAFPPDPASLPPASSTDDGETKGKGTGKYEEVNAESPNQDRQQQEKERVTAPLAPRAAARARGRPRGRRNARGAGRGKGRKKATVSAIPEFEHFEWRCPVGGCERAHFSVRAVVTGARWKHDGQRGAVGMFV